MRISDVIAQYILEQMEEAGGCAEIQRNELAGSIGCVPSQINYVITSRFTPEQGYIVESQRGGGGYIRITRRNITKQDMVMHVINNIGDRLDAASLRVILNNLYQQNAIGETAYRLIAAATGERSFAAVPPEARDTVRAAIFKNMLLVTNSQN